MGGYTRSGTKCMDKVHARGGKGGEFEAELLRLILHFPVSWGKRHEGGAVSIRSWCSLSPPASPPFRFVGISISDVGKREPHTAQASGSTSKPGSFRPVRSVTKPAARTTVLSGTNNIAAWNSLSPDVISPIAAFLARPPAEGEGELDPSTPAAISPLRSRRRLCSFLFSLTRLRFFPFP